MGNGILSTATPGRLSSRHPDVEVYHVRDIWVHFSKAYSLGAGTFGLVFAAHPRTGTSKISRALSITNDVKHSVPVPLVTASSDADFSVETSRKRLDVPIMSRLSSSPLETIFRSSPPETEHTFPKVGKASSTGHSPIAAVPRKSKAFASIRRMWSGDHSDEKGSNATKVGPIPDFFPAVSSSEGPVTLDFSDGSDVEEPRRGALTLKARKSLSPHREAQKKRQDRARSVAVHPGESINFEVAVKVITKATDKAERSLQKAEFANEIRILQRLLDGQGVVQYLGALVDKRHFCIVTEMCRGGELWTFLAQQKPEHKFSEFDASKIIRQILQGLNHCHINDIAHLDLKPENIVLQRKNDLSSLKIVDFGCAKFTSDAKGNEVTYEEFKGSLDFAAPEVIAQFVNVKGEFIKAVDMWAVGVLTFQMVTGSLPFGMGNDGQKRRKIFGCEYQLPESLSPAVRDFIAHLLVKDPAARMTVAESLSHPWINNPNETASKESFDPMVLRGLRGYQNVTLLRKIVAALLVRAMTDKEMENLQKTFRRYDTDSSGFLELNEVVSILKGAFELTDDQAKSEAESVVESFDLNSDGVISWEEFAELSLQGSLATDKSRIRRAFNLLDENSDGVISIEELKKALNIGKEQALITDEEFIRLIKEVDENNDGVISYEEFSRGISDEASSAPALSRVCSSGSGDEKEDLPRDSIKKLHSRHRSSVV